PSLPHPALHPFPTRRSSDLLYHVPTLRRLDAAQPPLRAEVGVARRLHRGHDIVRLSREHIPILAVRGRRLGSGPRRDLDHFHVQDRKSTRLNSSHVAISYAV